MAQKFDISVVFQIVDKASRNVKRIGGAIDRSITPAVDRASGAMRKFGGAISRIRTKLDGLSGKLKNVGDKMTDIGKKAATRITLPVIGLAAGSLAAFDKQAKAVEQVRVGIEATGGVAGKTLKDLTGLATKMQQETLFGDEEILAGATAQLLTFTNIAGNEFDRTQQAVLDVATRLSAARGGVVDLTSTSIMLGKALNDPVANMGALGRAGIQFSEDQKKVIKQLAKSGQMAKAQAIILAELEKQYGGSAKAAAKAGTGGLTQLKNLLGDLMEQIGEIVYKGLEPFISSLKEITVATMAWIKENPGLTRLIIIFAGIAAAIGPILFGFGVLLKLLGPITTGFTAVVKVGGFLIKTIKFLVPLVITLGKFLAAALAGAVKGFIALQIAGGPLLWIIQAIALAAFLIYKNWDKIKPFLLGILETVQAAFKSFYNATIKKLKSIGRFFRDIFSGIGSFAANIFTRIKNTFKNAFAGIKDIFITIFNAIKQTFIEFTNFFLNKIKTFGGILSGIVDKISSFFGGKPVKVNAQMQSPPPGGAPGTFVAKNESQTDINIKVTSDQGSTALVQDVKKKKGDSRVRVASDTSIGRTVPI